MLRGLLSLLLILAGLALTFVSIPSVWVDRDLLDTEQHTAAVAPLIEEPTVRDQVADAIATPISQRLGLGSLLDRALREATVRAVETDAFARAWTDAVRLSHQHAVEGLRDEGTGVNFAEDGVVVDRAALVEALRPRLAEAGLPFADRIPPGEGSIVLARGPEVARAATVARLADEWATPIAVAAGLLLLLGVVVARRRGLALVVAGLGVLAVAGVWWWGISSDANGVLSVVDDQPASTTVLLWDALSDPLHDLVRSVALGGGVMAAAGVVLAVVGGVRGQRTADR
ncbi:hypothetical protein [Nocardioides daphniae]|nr:hypothetical protein [Nocardioides daphniae]QCC76650.1 hypothetical protein E2C04_04470 [Nocardioides daphniae]